MKILKKKLWGILVCLSLSICLAINPVFAYSKTDSVGQIQNEEGCSIKETDIRSIPAVMYTGDPLTPDVTVTHNGKTLVCGQDYTVSYTDNTAPGIAYAEITGTRDYYGSKTVCFGIRQADIADADISFNESTSASGLPAVTVALNGRTLVADRDYVSVYKTSPSIISVEIYGVGNYSGRKTGQTTLSEATLTETPEIYRGIQGGKTYRIVPANNTNNCIAIRNGSILYGENITTAVKNNKEESLFIAEAYPDGTFRFVSQKSDAAIEIPGGSSKNSTAIVTARKAESRRQRWKVLDNGDGTYTFVNKKAGTVMDVRGGARSAGAVIQGYASNGTIAQRFYLVETAAEPHTYTGRTEIFSAKNTNFAVDIAGGSSANGANVQLYQANKTAAQMFDLYYSGNGWYRIENVKSGKVLDVAGGSKRAGTNVQQYRWNGTAAQLWKIIGNANGTYTFLNKNGCVLDLSGAIIANRRNIQAYTDNKTVAQQWIIDPWASADSSAVTTQSTASAETITTSSRCSLVPLKEGRQNAAENTKILQDAIDRMSNVNGCVILPEGTFHFVSQRYFVRADIVALAKDNVSVIGQGIDKTVLRPYGTYQNGCNMFATHGDKTDYLENNYYSDFTIDESEVYDLSYNNQGKGFMFSPFRNCTWERVKVKNTDGTGFGVDLPINGAMYDCIAENCGKAATQKNSGASGFGIGTGYSEDESFLIENCQSYGNTKFGFFFEHQSRFSGERNISAETAKGYIVRNCIAQNNLYDFGGVRANDVLIENCTALAPTSPKVISVNKAIWFENHSVNIAVKDCRAEELFADVPVSHPCFNAVTWACNHGIMTRNGSSGTNILKADESVTRGGTVEAVFRAVGRPGRTTIGSDKNVNSGQTGLISPYNDVAITDAWFEAACWAKGHNIITNTDFNGRGDCTKAMLITILYRTAGCPAVTNTEIFGGMKGNEWYYPQACWAAEQGLLDRNKTFAANAAVSRAELAKTLYDFCTSD